MVTGQHQTYPKCDQDWLRDDEEVEIRKVTIIYSCFGLIDLELCFDIETLCTRIYKYDIY